MHYYISEPNAVGIGILAWRGFVGAWFGCVVPVSVEVCWTRAGCSGVVTMSFSSVAGVTSSCVLSS